MANNTFLITDKATVEQSTIVYAVKNPTAFKVERYKISTLSRIANGDMVGDMVARKYKFYFTYEAIAAYELNKLLEAIWDIDGMFFYLHVPEGTDLGHRATYCVYAGSIPATLHYGNHNPKTWIWKNVTFDLIQK
ncbi:MAG: hypothetical protein IJ421_00225 [Prevotella sp.]|nr:hypothetical protein [Prevotella sp.]